MVERLTAALGGGNEDLELLADGLLPDIFVEKRRAQRAVDVLFVGTGRAAVMMRSSSSIHDLVQRASALRARRMPSLTVTSAGSARTLA